MNPYPQPPWTLRGQALNTVQLVPIRAARPHVPAEMRIFPVLPGLTAGGLFVSRYGPGSTLEYSELIVVCAITTATGRLGFCISHIYVDDERSMWGGREVWGLPKQLATFVWTDNGVTVTHRGAPLCTVSAPLHRFRFPLRAPAPAFGRSGAILARFIAVARSKAAVGLATWNVSDGSPFASLGMGGRRVTVRHYDLVASVPRPTPL